MGRQQTMYNFGEYCQPLSCKGTLQNKDLWKQFHDLQTEMIITKSGRRMFPSLRVQLSDLDPNSYYCVLLEMVPASNCRYKYSASLGWTAAGNEEAHSPHRLYLHLESPASGEHWMSQPVSFGRVKLTNAPAPPPGLLVLSSMHKYQPRIIIAKTTNPRAVAWAPSTVISFEETQFIAVTAYQNEKITKLKIDNNPFAKGFRENGQSVKSKRKRTSSNENDTSDDSDSKRARVDSPKRDSGDESTSSASSSPDVQVLESPSSYSSALTYNNYVPCGYQPPHPASPVFYPHYSQYGCCRGINWHTPSPYYRTQIFSADFYNLPDVTNIAKPKKLTDFSIKTIIGNS